MPEKLGAAHAMREKALVDGMHEYSSWLTEGLERGVSPTDIDCVLHSSRTHTFLIAEFKRHKAWPKFAKDNIHKFPVGQKISHIDLIYQSYHNIVIYVREPKEAKVNGRYPRKAEVEVLSVPPISRGWSVEDSQVCTIAELNAMYVKFNNTGVCPELHWRNWPYKNQAAMKKIQADYDAGNIYPNQRKK